MGFKVRCRKCLRKLCNLGRECLERLRKFRNRWASLATLISVIVTTAGVIATSLGVWFSYSQLKKHDVHVIFYRPAHSQYVAGTILVDGAIIGRPYDNVVIELVGQDLKWNSFPFMLDTTQLPDGEHQLRCVVYHKGAPIANSSVHFFVKNSPPSVLITNLRDGDVISDTISIETKIDPSAQSIKFFLNDRELYSAPILNTKYLPDGDYVLTVVAIGPSGIPGRHSVSVIIDNTPPLIKYPGLDFKVPISGTHIIFPDIEEKNVSAVILYVDEAYICEGLPLVLDTLKWSDGEHRLRLVVQDRAGHEACYEGTFFVDNTPPILHSSLPSDRVIRLPRWFPLFIDATAEDPTGIANIEYYINNTPIKPGWQSFTKYQSHSIIEIKIIAQDFAGNKTEQKVVVEIIDFDLNTMLNAMYYVLKSYAFNRESSLSFGVSLRRSFSISSISDTTAQKYIETTPLWFELTLSPLILQGPSTLTGFDLGIYLNQGLLEAGLISVKPLIEFGGMTSATVLNMRDEYQEVLWCNIGWIDFAVELNLAFDYYYAQYRFGVGIAFLLVVEGYARFEPGGPGPLAPPDKPIAERSQIIPLIAWPVLSFKIPLR